MTDKISYYAGVGLFYRIPEIGNGWKLVAMGKIALFLGQEATTKNLIRLADSLF